MVPPRSRCACAFASSSSRPGLHPSVRISHSRSAAFTVSAQRSLPSKPRPCSRTIASTSNERPLLAYSAASAYERPEPKEKFAEVSATPRFPRVDLGLFGVLGFIESPFRRRLRIWISGKVRGLYWHRSCTGPDDERDNEDDPAEDQPADQRGSLLGRHLLRSLATPLHWAWIAVEFTRDLADRPVAEAELAPDRTKRAR